MLRPVARRFHLWEQGTTLDPRAAASRPRPRPSDATEHHTPRQAIGSAQGAFKGELASTANMASVAAATAPVAKADPSAAGEKKLPPPSPLRSILAGSLAGGIEICSSFRLQSAENHPWAALLTDFCW